MSVAVVLVAAGKGKRLGAGQPKAAINVAGKSLLELSLMHVSEFRPDQLVVVAPDLRPNTAAKKTIRFHACTSLSQLSAAVTSYAVFSS